MTLTIPSVLVMPQTFLAIRVEVHTMQALSAVSRHESTSQLFRTQICRSYFQGDGYFVCLGRFFWVGKSSEILGSNMGYPSSLIKTNPFIPTPIVPVLPTVIEILDMGNFPKIAAAVV